MLKYPLIFWSKNRKYYFPKIQPIKPVYSVRTCYSSWICRFHCGSERAGQRAAAIQTLLGTAKLNGLNPADWLKDTLEKLPAWPNSRIDELLPLSPEDIDAIKQKLPEKAKW